MSKAKWRNFSHQEIEQYVKDSRSYMSLASKLGYNTDSGSWLSTLKSMIEELNLDISHFTGQAWNKNNFDYSRFKKDVAIKSSQAIGALTFLRGHCCENCGLEDWMSRPIPLEVHHIDGDSLNNEISNLKLLCPNCHALTDNYRGKNINYGSKIISDDELIKSLQDNPSIRQALKKVGLTAKGGNYQRARELIVTHNIDHLMRENDNN